MKKALLKLSIFLFAIFTITCVFSVSASEKHTKEIEKSYGNLPMSFEANNGQVDKQVDFIARGKGYDLFLTQNEAVLALDKYAFRMQLLNSNSAPIVSGVEKQQSISNYFIGNDPNKWHTNISHYAKVKYQNVYDGIDLLYYGNQRQLEYDFIVSPGANPNDILLGFQGADKINIDNEGNLVLQFSGGEKVIQKAPVIYQEIKGRRTKIEGQYIKKGKYEVGFEVSYYDVNLALVIDPVVFYTTLIGGNGLDVGIKISVGNNGDAFIAGITTSTDFPTTSGAFDIIKAGPTTGSSANDIFVAKLSPDGSSLIYSTYLGGSSRENAARLVVDDNGIAYISSWTLSTDFPTTPGVIGETPFGVGGTVDDIIVAKLSASGDSLIYSTYIGSSGDDEPFALAVDNSGNAYVSGHSTSSNYPVTPGSFSTTKSTGFDNILTKINANADTILYSTFFGGNGVRDEALDIVLNANGTAFITGRTNSTDYPVTTGAFQTANNGGFDNFLTVIDPAGNGTNDMLYSTYFGGSGNEQARAIAIDASGKVYISGLTPSSDFNTTAGAYQTTFAGGTNDCFITKFDPAGNGVSDLLYSTFLGGRMMR